LGFLLAKGSRKQVFLQLKVRDTSIKHVLPAFHSLFKKALDTIKFYLRTFYKGMSMNGVDLRLYSETNHKLLIVIGEITDWGAIGQW
jgi:hypothetical protein